MKRRIGIQGVLIFIAVVSTLLLFRTVSPAWKREPLDEVMDALGIVLILFGYLFRIAARGYKEEHSLRGGRLVTDGPYAFVRNPMYLGTLLIGTGVIFVLLNLWMISLFLLIFLSIYIPQIKHEKQHLSKTFGREYLDYCNTVPLFVPRLDSLLHIRNYIFFRVSWVKKELRSVIIVLVLMIVLEAWKDAALFGSKEFYKEIKELLIIILFFISLIIVFFRRENYQFKPKNKAGSIVDK